MTNVPKQYDSLQHHLLFFLHLFGGIDGSCRRRQGERGGGAWRRKEDRRAADGMQAARRKIATLTGSVAVVVICKASEEVAPQSGWSLRGLIAKNM